MVALERKKLPDVCNTGQQPIDHVLAVRPLVDIVAEHHDAAGSASGVS
jgi:hypothetical protein